MAAAALESNAPRSVSLSHAELTLVKSSSTCGGSSLLKRGVPQSLSASMVWRTAQLARIAEAGRGFVLGEGAEAKAVTDALGAALCTLEHSIEEEVCAWDDREWNYVAAMAAHKRARKLFRRSRGMKDIPLPPPHPWPHAHGGQQGSVP